MPVNYVCDICFKNFTLKGNYTQHLQRQKPCNPKITLIEPIVINIIQPINENQCNGCNKLFFNKSSRIRHEKVSKCFTRISEIENIKENLRKEKKIEEEKEEKEEKEKEYSCSNCYKNFSNKKNRDLHEQTINCNQPNKQKTNYKKQQISHTMRRQVWSKYIGDEIGQIKCLCCKLSEITQLTFVCGHIISESTGGETCIDNLLPICNSCNLSMGTTNLNEFVINNEL